MQMYHRLAVSVYYSARNGPKQVEVMSDIFVIDQLETAAKAICICIIRWAMLLGRQHQTQPMSNKLCQSRVGKPVL